MTYYMTLNPKEATIAAKSICRSKFLVLNIITIIALIGTVALYTIPKSEPKESALLPSRNLVVPNIVHFIRYGPGNLTFMDAVCILAALKQQKPVRLYVHTDQKEFVGGKYWEVVKTHRLGRGIVELQYLHSVRPKDTKNTENKPTADPLVDKLKILMKFGGIYLDNDCYLVKSLSRFRRYELTLGWVRQKAVPHSMIIASRDAKFLPLWLDSNKKKELTWVFRRNTDAYKVLKNRPSLVNWMTEWMSESRDVIDTVYLESSGYWKNYYVIKLFSDQQYLIPRNLSHKATYPVVFNESNILDYQVNIQDMVATVYPLSEKESEEKREKKKLNE